MASFWLPMLQLAAQQMGFCKWLRLETMVRSIKKPHAMAHAEPQVANEAITGAQLSQQEASGPVTPLAGLNSLK
jgi:hypothetical protein